MSENSSQIPSAASSVASEQADNKGVAVLLRESREHNGKTINDISDALRIRQPYLEAIEDGRFSDLPGQTYAIGFMRAYAEYLGLDSEEMVRRYKDEVVFGLGPSQLRFPTPMAEAGIPSGIVVFFGLLAVVLIYGAWLLNTSGDGFLSDLVSPLPERFATLILSEEKIVEDDKNIMEPKKGPEQKSVLPTESKLETETKPKLKSMLTTERKQEAPLVEGPGLPDYTEQPLKSDSKIELEQSSEKTPRSNSNIASTVPAETSAKNKAKQLSLLVEPITSEMVVEPIAPEKVVEPIAPEKVVEPMAPEKKDLETVSTVSGQATRTDKLLIDPQAQLESVNPIGVPASSSLTPQILPSSDLEPMGTKQPTNLPPSVSRITIRALVNSWIEVRDDFSNTNLMARLLNKGDSYDVPDQAGLSLHTGNAGALEILVDGVVVPAIGEIGAVQRGVQLDPDALVAGTATQ